MIYERNDGRVRVNTRAIIKSLTIKHADLPDNLLSRFPIRNNSIVSSLICLSGMVTGRGKGGRNKSTIDKIKNLLKDYSSSSQQKIVVKAVLKDPIFSTETGHAGVVNIKNNYL